MAPPTHLAADPPTHPTTDTHDPRPTRDPPRRGAERHQTPNKQQRCTLHDSHTPYQHIRKHSDGFGLTTVRPNCHFTITMRVPHAHGYPKYNSNINERTHQTPNEQQQCTLHGPQTPYQHTREHSDVFGHTAGRANCHLRITMRVSHAHGYAKCNSNINERSVSTPNEQQQYILHDPQAP